MRVDGLILVIPQRADPERDAVAAAWEAGGGQVTRLDRYWRPPPLEPSAVRLYGPEVFVMLLAQLLELRLLSPADDALVTLPPALLRRTLSLRTLAVVAETVTFPAFVKSAVPKLLTSRVYGSWSALATEAAGLEPETALLVAEPVSFVWEARAFVLDGQVLDCAPYEGQPEAGALAGVQGLVDALAGRLPRACVVDVGWIAGRGLALVELNAAWGAGLNGCSAARVLPAIAAATTTATV